MQKKGPKILMVCLVLAFAASALIYFWSPVRESERFNASVKKSVNPEELRTWAAAMSTNKYIGPITDAGALPESLRYLNPHFEEIAVFRPPRASTDPYVLIIYGGGFFHWGMMVGPSNYINSGEPGSTVERWIPGIYFKREGR